MSECKGCRWWKWSTGLVGDCRRYAPKESYLDPTLVSYRGVEDAARWPRTEQFDWCGEFEPQESDRACRSEPDHGYWYEEEAGSECSCEIVSPENPPPGMIYDKGVWRYANLYCSIHGTTPGPSDDTSTEPVAPDDTFHWLRDQLKEEE